VDGGDIGQAVARGGFAHRADQHPGTAQRGGGTKPSSSVTSSPKKIEVPRMAAFIKVSIAWPLSPGRRISTIILPGCRSAMALGDAAASRRASGSACGLRR
jgi:hypothetical protein